MPRPVPEAFGLSADELPHLEELAECPRGLRWMEKLLRPLVKGWFGELVGGLLFWTLLWPFYFVGLLLSPIISLFPERDSTILAYRRFASALAEFERIQAEYWLRLDGSALEREVALLLRRLGHSVQVTGGAGDRGIDLRIDGSTILQCKAHRTALSPSAARDLLGAKEDSHASAAILVCTSGFSRATREFATRNGIQLWDAHTLIALQERAASQSSKNEPS